MPLPSSLFIKYIYDSELNYVAYGFDEDDDDYELYKLDSAVSAFMDYEIINRQDL